MRICLIYDCLFPWTIGGAERWYRALAQSLVAKGHSVTYLTLSQWDDDRAPAIPGIAVIPVGPRMPLYVDGRRRMAPPLRFGWGVFVHLFLHGRRYDHVHTANFPYFALLAAGLLRPFRRYSLGVDWHEVWTRQYWREYLGRPGLIGWWVQRVCAAVPQRAFGFSKTHLARLADLGRKGELLTGEYAGGEHVPMAATEPATVVYAGRLIPEKRVELLVEAFALVRASLPELRLRIVGDGAERASLVRRITELGLRQEVELTGFVPQAELDTLIGKASVVVQPSSREGYGMIVVEAGARGVPAIVVESPDNAAVELIEAGENGLVASATAQSLADAMRTVVGDNAAWRSRTRRWYAANRERLSLEHSLATVAAVIGA